MRRLRARHAIGAAVLAVVLAGCGSTEGLSGADLYARSCASCHGGEGGGAVGPALDGGSAAADLTDDQIGAVIRVGPGTMPSFDRLTDAQIASLVAFIRTLPVSPPVGSWFPSRWVAGSSVSHPAGGG